MRMGIKLYDRGRCVLDEIAAKLTILSDCLHKKEAALTAITNITKNQGDMLSGGLPEEESAGLFYDMNREKQEHIETVLQCDAMFESVLKEIGPTLDADPKKYAGQIKAMQDDIRRVVDLDVNIRVKEERNNDAMAKRRSKPKFEKIRISPVNNARLVRAYAENSKKFV